MLRQIAIIRYVRKLNDRIDENGYTLTDLAPVWQDKAAVFIFVVLLIKALRDLCKQPRRSEINSESKKQNYISVHPSSVGREVYQNRDFFVIMRFVESL